MAHTAFGIFDHVDRGDEPLASLYEHRLRLVDAAIVGSPQTVRAEVERHLSATGCNYFVGRFIYGNLGYEPARRSLDLFCREVMPHFQEGGRP